MAEVEIRYLGRRIEHFQSDIDPADEFECLALLKRRARELRRPVNKMVLVTWEPRRKHRREYRA
jgi:hypothetical protein